MGQAVRRTGIEVAAEASWGAHFCLFYHTQDDLIDILVPYFKAGLEDNEYCMWVTSEPLSAEDARRVLVSAVGNLDDYVQKGQIEILDTSQWYTRSGRFEASEVLRGWVAKEQQALERGFDGLRLTGNTFWLETRDWGRFVDYEAAVDRALDGHRMMAVCTYSLGQCGPAEIMDAVSNHELALVRRKGRWETIGSEERYRRLFAEAMDGIALADLQTGTLLDCNRALAALVGWERDELIGRPQQMLHPPEDHLGDVSVTFDQHRTGKRGQVITTRVVTKAGETRDVEIKANVVRLKGRDVVQGIFRDITERKRAEDALRESEARYRTLFDAGQDAVLFFPIAADGMPLSFTEVNEVACRMFGYTRAELLAMSATDLIAPEYRGMMPGLGSRLIANRCFRAEWEDIAKDGRRIPVDVSATLIELGGQPIAMAVVRDITERKRAEEALRESEERLRMALDSATTVAWEQDLATGALAETGPVESLFGRPKGFRHTSQQDFFESVHPDDREGLSAALQAAAGGKRTYQVEFRVPMPGWEVRWVRATGGFAHDSQGRAITLRGIARDVTVRKRAEEALQKAHGELERRVEERTRELATANEALRAEVAVRQAAEAQIRTLSEDLARRLIELEAANRELEAFSYSVSHDLRAPLTVVQGFGEALLEECAPALGGQGTHYAERIQAGCGRMAELIDDLLKLAHVTRAEMSRRTVDLSQMAREIAAELRESQPDRQAEFLIVHGLVAEGDAPLLRILLEHLLGNAWKFTSGHPAARIEFGAAEAEGGRAYRVRDDGVGFDMAYADKLFAPFQRFHAQDEFPGTGIGLATVRRIVHRHGGRVWAEAAPERGATFYFTLR